MKGKLVSTQILGGEAHPTIFLQFELAEISEPNLNLLGLTCQLRTESPMKPMLVGSLSCYDFGHIENGRQISAAISLDYLVLNVIENARKAMASPEKDVWFRIQGDAFVAKGVPKRIDESVLLEDVRFYKESFAARYGNYGDGIVRIPETDWLRWLQEWGKNTRTIFASDIAAEKLNRMFQELGASSDEDFIDKVEKSLVELRMLKEGVGINQAFLCTLPQEKRIRSKLTEVLNRVAGRKGEVLATGWLDGALEAEVHEVLKNGGRVRIIARKSTDKSVLDVVNRLKRSGAKIKTNNMVHARVFVAEDECIVGSADLKSDSLDLNREAGVYTTDPVVVLSVKDFFDKLWMDEESIDLR